LFNPPAIAAVDYDGSAPGESQAVLLQPVSPVDRIHALFLTGGGPFALPASGGVLRFFEERKVGFASTADVRILIVAPRVIDDLAVGDPRIRPDAAASFQVRAAAHRRPAEGNVGPAPAPALARCTVRGA
jgi:L-aminopeptidase/D-esterase-like protein